MPYHDLSPSSSDEEHEPERGEGEVSNAAALAVQQQWQQERAAQLAEEARELLWGEESEEDGAPGGQDDACVVEICTWGFWCGPGMDCTWNELAYEEMPP